MAERQIQFGWKVDDSAPIDSRFTAANQTARLSIPVGVVYEGLWVYQEDNNTTYVLTDASDPGDTASWATIGSGGGGGGNADGRGYYEIKGFNSGDTAITATEEGTISFSSEFTVTNGSDQTNISIDEIDVSKLTGSFTADQLPSIPASKLIGTIELDRLNNTLQTIGNITLPGLIDSDTFKNYNLRLTDVGGTETWSLQEVVDEGGIAKYSDSSTYSDGDVVWFEDDDNIYVWTSSTDSTAGDSPSDNATDWQELGGDSFTGGTVTGDTTFQENVTIGNTTISSFTNAKASGTDRLNVVGSTIGDMNFYSISWHEEEYFINPESMTGEGDDWAVRTFVGRYLGNDDDETISDVGTVSIQERFNYNQDDNNWWNEWLLEGKKGNRSNGNIDSSFSTIIKAGIDKVEIPTELEVNDTLTLNRTDAGLLDIIGDSSNRTGVTSRIRGFRGTTETWAIEGYQASGSNNNDGRLIIKGRGDNTMNQVFRYDPADNPITFGGTNQVNAIIDIKNIDGPDDFAIVLDRTGLNLENVNDSQGLNFFNPAGVLEPAEVSAYFRPTELHLQHGASGTPGSVNISGRNISPSTGNKELLRIYAQGRSSGSSDFDNTFGDIQFFGDTTGEGKIRFRVDGSADEDSIAATDTVFEMLSERVDALKPLALNSRTSAPTEMLTNGLMWYDSTNNQIVARINGTNENLSFGADDNLEEGAYSNVTTTGSIKSSGSVTVGSDSYSVIQYKIGDNYYYRVFGFGTPDETIVTYTGDGTENDTTIPTDLLTDGKYTITDTKNY